VGWVDLDRISVERMRVWVWGDVHESIHGFEVLFFDKDVMRYGSS
jgi:hypothetical protein